MFFIIASLISAVGMGAGDFYGGMASKQAPVAVVGLINQTLGLVAVIAIIMFSWQPFAQTPFCFGLGAGLCGSVALLCLYRGLAIGKVAIVAPVSAVLSALIPVIVAVLGGHVFGPITWVGIILGLAGVYFLSLPSEQASDNKETGILHGIAAGVALAFFYMLLGNADCHGNIWTICGERTAVISVMIAAILFRRIKISKTIPGLKLILLAGACDIVGNLGFLYGSSLGPLPMVALISSLYPAMTMFMGWLILKETVNRSTMIGIICAFACIVIFAMP